MPRDVGVFGRAARDAAGRCPRCGRPRQISAPEEPQRKGPAWVVVTGRCPCAPTPPPDGSNRS
ncbi:hypothetical protein GCM10009863_33030 [Streptomyces axinellae]|uniref:Uncharacterized protein n=1 Tax=Streptomyces axinellae TaxID=552788 RepID=A0ABP6CDX9_9ACTN